MSVKIDLVWEHVFTPGSACRLISFLFSEPGLIEWNRSPIIFKQKKSGPGERRIAFHFMSDARSFPCIPHVLCWVVRECFSVSTVCQWPTFGKNICVDTRAKELRVCSSAAFFCVWVNCGLGGIFLYAPPPFFCDRICTIRSLFLVISASVLKKQQQKNLPLTQTCRNVVHPITLLLQVLLDSCICPQTCKWNQDVTEPLCL